MGLFAVNPLVGCHAKVDRAESHLAELEGLLRAWRRSANDDSADGVYDPGRGVWTVAAPTLGTPPLQTGAVVGDVLNNLRTCLDQLVAGLVASNGGVLGRHHQFPFALTEDEWAKATKGNRCALAGIRSSDLAVLRRHQPIDDPKAVLRGLRVMSNAEKHALYLPTLLVFTRMAVTQGAQHPHRVLIAAGELLDPGEPVAEFEVPLEQVEEIEVALGTEVAFAQAHDTGAPIGRLGDLREFVRLVRSLLADFEIT